MLRRPWRGLESVGGKQSTGRAQPLPQNGLKVGGTRKTTTEISETGMGSAKKGKGSVAPVTESGPFESQKRNARK